MKAEIKRSRCSHVYVVGLQAGGAVKVGISNDPVRRMAALRMGWAGQPMALFFAQEHPQAQRVEGRALRLLAQHRIGGEWFSVTPEAAIAAVRVATKQEDEQAKPKPIFLLRGPPSPKAQFFIETLGHLNQVAGLRGCKGWAKDLQARVERHLIGMGLSREQISSAKQD